METSCNILPIASTMLHCTLAFVTFQNWNQTQLIEGLHLREAYYWTSKWFQINPLNLYKDQLSPDLGNSHFKAKSKLIPLLHNARGFIKI